MIELGFAHFFAQLDPLGWILLGTLASLSVASWSFFLGWLPTAVLRRVRTRRYLLAALAVDDPFASPTLVAGGARVAAALTDEVRAALRQRESGESFADAGGLAAHLTRILRQRLDRSAIRRERGLALLATTAATAPYLGLLGTVWGIYHALLRIGATGEAGLAAVAGPVGEALIMTALGLAVAIPAVFAHNLVQRHNRLDAASLEDFATNLLRRATVPAMPAEGSVGERALGLAVVGRSAEV